MKHQVWKTLVKLLFVLSFLFVCGNAFSQITAIHVNAEWNKTNSVDWFSELKECKKKNLLIEEEGVQKKYNIAVVPTILLFKDGEEVKRFQADISFKMAATRKEIQEYIDDLIMSDF